jgi:hypothetical protein
MITATHDGITVATTTGTDADAQAAAGMTSPVAVESPPSTEAPTSESIPETPVEASAPAEAGDEGAPAAPADDKKSSYQSRIDRFRWEAGEAQRRAAEAEARAQAVAAELEAVRAARAAQEADEPKLEAFESYEAWIKAQARWEAQQEARKQVAALQARVEAREAERARVDVQAQYRDRVEAVRSEFPDFDAVTSRDDITVSLPVKQFIEHHPLGPRLAYALGKMTVEEAEALASIPPDQSVTLGMQIGRVLARLEAASPTGPASTTASRSSAPPPIKPVGSSAAAATVPLDQADFQTYKKIRDQQEQEWRRSRL